MTDTFIIEKAIEEVETKTFGVTEQLLEIHQVAYADNTPIIARIDREKDDGTAIVYFPIKDEKFYLAVYLDSHPQVSVRFVGTEPNNCVYFRAFSDKFSFDELSKMTQLKPTGGRNKGDKKRPTGGTGVLWKESTIFYEPNPEPDEFEDKLKKLLDYLETDKDGVAMLVDRAEGHIQVAIEFHNGNTMLGGLHINKESLKRITDLNLEINFDFYAGGKFFKD